MAPRPRPTSSTTWAGYLWVSPWPSFWGLWYIDDCKGQNVAARRSGRLVHCGSDPGRPQGVAPTTVDLARASAVCVGASCSRRVRPRLSDSRRDGGATSQILRMSGASMGDSGPQGLAAADLVYYSTNRPRPSILDL